MALRKINPLRNWIGLNRHLISLTSSKDAGELLEEEKAGKKRRNFLERIHQRYCSLRAIEERDLLLKISKKGKKK